MITVLLVIHILIAVSLIGIVLLQRSEGGALGIGGGQGGLVSGRSAANLLTRTTTILATAFFVSSVTLAVFAGGGSKPKSIVAPSPQETPAQPGLPRAPLSQ